MPGMMKRATLAAIMCALGATCLVAEEPHSVEGMVLQVNPASRSIVVSCKAIPRYMDAMVMPFKVRDATALKGLEPGTTVRFTMVAHAPQDYADHLEVIKAANYEAEPTEAARLAFLHRTLDPAAASKAVSIGQQVPDFTLTDQAHQPIHLAHFRGKVVALAFAYARCPNPNYCFRLSNNLSQLRRRFRDRMGADLVLLTIMIDPANDQGKALAHYAETWKADPATWHFLTGPLANVEGVAQLFGMNFWNDEGFLTHSFHTVVVDREGRLASNLEGNQFSAEQLGDLVETVLSRPRIAGGATP